MSSGDIILQVGLAEGRNADAAIAAESLLAWIDLARDAARAIDPLSDIRVELLGREEGSLKQVLRLVDEGLAAISAGADQFPYIKKAAIGLAIATASSGIDLMVHQTFEPQVQEVTLSQADRALLEQMTKSIGEDEHTARSSKRFYRALERDPAVTNVVVKTGDTDAALVKVDRAEFAMRGGLFSSSAVDNVEQARREVWSVVLLQAPFYASPKRWRFSRDGVPFTAVMADAVFLQAIVDGTMPISLRTGVRMEVEVEWRERQSGKTWITMQGTRRISRVLTPRPSPGSSTDSPKEREQTDEDRQ